MARPRPLGIAPPPPGVVLVIAAGAAAILAAERWRPSRRRTQAEPKRILRNLALGALSMAVVSTVEDPVVKPLTHRAQRRRRGLLQRLPLPVAARDALAFLAMDYTIYLWHVLTHKVPALWRLHLVHHVDLDLDASTALRFHAADMLVSTPYRALQVAALGVSPRAFAAWRAFFFLSVLFHHSNLRLPPPWERRLSRVLTTPLMHAIHHTAARDRTDSNWSSGLSLWDRLHGTFRLDAPPDGAPIGVPAYRDPAEIALHPSLTLPFVRQRDAWRPRAARDRHRPETSMTSPRELSRDLRLRTNPDLRRRRWLVGLSLLGVAMGQIVALFQTGIVRRLPDPPIGPFDSSRVDASDFAYKRLQMPDAFLMIGTYAVTAGLAAAGGRDRAETAPLLPVAMAAKTLFDTATNLKLAQEEWGENQALCAYCQVATAASLMSVALALPEAARGLRRLLGR